MVGPSPNLVRDTTLFAVKRIVTPAHNGETLIPPSVLILKYDFILLFVKIKQYDEKSKNELRGRDGQYRGKVEETYISFFFPRRDLTLAKAKRVK